MTQAFRHFFADCITHSAPALVAEVFGAERILLGSDWPFSMGLVDPHAQLVGVAPALLDAIAGSDPERPGG